MISKDDNELVFEVIHGSISSFEVLIDRYQKTIFNLMLQMTGDIEAARDLSQDVFVKAFEKLGGFDFRHRFFSWIYRIAINEAIDWNRKSKPTERLDKVEHLLPDIPDSRDMEIQSILLHRELRRLEANYRVLILLKYYCGLSYDEIADATRIPVKKIRSRLFIARQQLRTGLISHGFFENDR